MKPEAPKNTSDKQDQKLTSPDTNVTEYLLWIMRTQFFLFIGWSTDFVAKTWLIVKKDQTTITAKRMISINNIERLKRYRDWNIPPAPSPNQLIKIHEPSEKLPVAISLENDNILSITANIEHIKKWTQEKSESTKY